MEFQSMKFSYPSMFSFMALCGSVPLCDYFSIYCKKDRPKQGLSLPVPLNNLSPVFICIIYLFYYNKEILYLI